MIRINLLTAHEISKEKKQEYFWQGILLAFLILIAGVLIGFWMLGNQVKNLKKEKAALEIQTRDAAALQKEIKELREKKEISLNRLSLLQNLEKERHGPVQLMESLSTILPVDQLWLTSLKETGTEIKIDGISLSNEILAEYMKRLETIPLFKQIDLVHSTQAVYKDMKVKNFTLIAWTKIPAPPAPPGEKK
jgi:type IV pilus assembly protein PilN